MSGLNALAVLRGQRLAQMAVAMALQGGPVTCAPIGDLRAEMVRDCEGALGLRNCRPLGIGRIDEMVPRAT